MKTSKLFIFLVLTALCKMTSCSEKSDDSGPVGTKSLQVTPGKLTFSAAGGTQQLEVKTTYAYYGYDITNITADHVIVVTSSSAGPEMYVKLNGTWTKVTRAYRKVSGTWTQVALDQAFQDGVDYKMA